MKHYLKITKKQLVVLLLFITFTSNAQVSYRFGLDTGILWGGTSVTAYPLQLQLNESFQIGILGIGINYYDNIIQFDDYDIERELTLPIASVKYDIKSLTIADDFVPFTKLSSYLINFEYGGMIDFVGDLKIGISWYLKKRKFNLSYYIGMTSIGDVNMSSTVAFNTGVMFEFGGNSAFGYGKYAHLSKAEKKELRRRRMNNALQGLSIAANLLNAAGEIYGTATGTEAQQTSSGGSSSGSSSGKSQSYYQTQYDRWENLAKRSYEQITSQSMSASIYSAKKKLLREQQSEMESIRKQAARDGYTISRSPWESANP